MFIVVLGSVQSAEAKKGQNDLPGHRCLENPPKRRKAPKLKRNEHRQNVVLSVGGNRRSSKVDKMTILQIRQNGGIVKLYRSVGNQHSTKDIAVVTENQTAQSAI